MTTEQLKSKLYNPKNIEGVMLNNGKEVVPADNQAFQLTNYFVELWQTGANETYSRVTRWRNTTVAFLKINGVFESN